MVAKTIEWEMEKIKHEFDSSFDAYPELRKHAMLAAHFLDHESGQTYPTTVSWSVKPDGFNRLMGPVIRIYLRDTTLGGGIEQVFTLADLQGPDMRFLLLRTWTDFLRFRMGVLTDRLFTPERKDEEIQ